MAKKKEKTLLDYYDERQRKSSAGQEENKTLLDYYNERQASKLYSGYSTAINDYNRRINSYGARAGKVSGTAAMYDYIGKVDKQFGDYERELESYLSEIDTDEARKTLDSIRKNAEGRKNLYNDVKAENDYYQKYFGSDDAYAYFKDMGNATAEERAQALELLKRRIEVRKPLGVDTTDLEKNAGYIEYWNNEDERKTAQPTQPTIRDRAAGQTAEEHKSDSQFIGEEYAEYYAAKNRLRSHSTNDNKPGGEYIKYKEAKDRIESYKESTLGIPDIIGPLRAGIGAGLDKTNKEKYEQYKKDKAYVAEFEAYREYQQNSDAELVAEYKTGLNNPVVRAQTANSAVKNPQGEYRTVDEMASSRDRRQYAEEAIRQNVTASVRNIVGEDAPEDVNKETARSLSDDLEKRLDDALGGTWSDGSEKVHELSELVEPGEWERFYALAGSGDVGGAVAYIEGLGLPGRGKQKEIESINSVEDFVLATLGKVEGDLFGSIGAAGNAAVQLLTDGTYDKDKDIYIGDIPVLSSKPYNQGQLAGEAASHTLNEIDPSGTLNFGYNVGISALESWLGGKLTKGFMALGVSEDVAKIPYLAIMSSGAAVSRAEELSERGASSEQIALGSLAAGVNEWFFEEVSLDTLIKGNPKKWYQHLIQAAKQAGVEASEEVFTEIANDIADAVVMGENSDFEREIRRLMAQEGLSYEEAKQKAGKQQVENVLLAGLAGALSGGLASFAYHGTAALGKARTGSNFRASENAQGILSDAAKGDTESGSIARSIKSQETQSGKKAGRVEYGSFVGAYQAEQQSKASEAYSKLEQLAAEKYDADNISSDLVERGMTEPQARAAASAVSKAIQGEELTDAEGAVLSNNRVAAEYVNDTVAEQDKIRSEAVAAEAKAYVTREASSSARTVLQKHYEDTSAPLKSNPITDAQISSANKAAEGSYSTDGKTTLKSSGEEVEIRRAVRAEDGSIAVELTNGKTVPISDVRFASKDDAVVWQTLSSIKGITPGAVNTLIKARAETGEGVSAGVWAKGVAEGYQIGREGHLGKKSFANAESGTTYLGSISNEARRLSERIGYHDLRVENKNQKRARRESANVKSGESQQQQLDRAKQAGEKLKRKVTIEDELKGDGYIDSKGGIHIGRETVDPVAFVIKHELSHYAETSPLYKAFETAVLNSKAFAEWIDGQVVRSGTTAQQKAAYLLDLKERYAGYDEELTYTSAHQEMIANFVGDMLFTEGGAGLEGMTSGMNAKERGTVRQFIDKFITWLKSKFKGEDFETAWLEKLFNRAQSTATGEMKKGKFSFGVTQSDIDAYVDKAYENKTEADYLKYAEADERLISDVSNKIDITGYSHALRSNDIRHIRNSHGEHTNEKYPVTADDIKAIPDIVENYDKVYCVLNNNNAGLYYVKVGANGIVYYLEQITSVYGNEPLLVNKQMIKTGIEDIPDIKGLKTAIKSKQTESEFLADLKARQVYAQSVYHNQSANNIIADFSEEINTVEQKISSAKTSIKQVPALFNNPNVKFGKTNVDIGGGRFDLATRQLAENGTTNYVFDPFNRGEEENTATLDFIKNNGGADTATCANVLNVIAEEGARANVILETAKAIKPGGTAYFMVYEGDGSGVGKETSSGWQNNRKTADYIGEISKYFEDVSRKGKLIIAENPVEDLPKAYWEVTPGKGVRYSIPEDVKRQDEKYLSAVKSGDMETTQRMVDEAAKAAGYDSPMLYHGTEAFGFTVADTSKSDDNISFFATDSEDVAKTYSWDVGRRDIGQYNADKKTYEENIDKLYDEMIRTPSTIGTALDHVAGQHWANYKELSNYIDELSEKTDWIDNIESEWEVRDYFESLLDDLYDATSEYYDDSDEFYSSDEVRRYREAVDESLNIVRQFVKTRELENPMGTYALYANTAALLELDGDGANWSRVPLGDNKEAFNKWAEEKSKDSNYALSKGYATADRATTRVIARFAKDAGFNGVKFNAIHDSGGRGNTLPSASTVYVFFNPQQQIKSADPVTYDDNGNVIPLSERFNPGNEDIRYSIPEQVAPEDEEYAREWVAKGEEYGVFPEGENNTSGIRTPKQVNDTTRVHRFVRTVLEDDFLSPEFVRQLGIDTLLNKRSYEPESDKWAMDYVEDATDADLKRRASKVIDSGSDQLTKLDVAATELLIKRAVAEGDVSRALELEAGLSAALTRAGQVVQAAHLFKQMTPWGKLMSLQKAVEQTNALVPTGRRRATIDEDLAALLLTTTTDEEQQAAADEIISDVAQQYDSSWLEKWNAWRYISMLVNPKTHIRNIVGNAAFIAPVYLKDVHAAIIEKIVFRNKPELRTKSLAVKPEYRAFAKEMLKSDVVKRMLKSSWGNYKTEIERQKNIFKNKPMRWIEDMPMGDLEREDMWFKNIHYVHALAGYLQARNVDVSRGVDFMTLPGAENLLMRANKYAVEQAYKNTYNDVNAFAKAVSELGRKYKVSRFIVDSILPFKKTPANIVKRGVEYSPIGLVSAIAKGAKKYSQTRKTEAAFKNGEISKQDYNAFMASDKAFKAAEFIDSLAAGLTGAEIFMLGWLLRSIGVLRGRFRDDEDKYLKTFGVQEYSLELFGGSFTIDWLAPINMPLLMGEEFGALLVDSKEGNPIGLSTLTQPALQAFQPFIQLSMLEGVQNTLNAAKYADETASVSEIMSSMAASYFSQAMPTILGAISRIADDKQRTSYKTSHATVDTFVQQMWNNFRAKIPGLSNTRPPYIDLWGREKSTGNFVERSIENFISPGYWNDISYTDVDNAVLKAYRETGDSGVFPQKAIKYIDLGKKGKKYLDEWDYCEYAQRLGTYRYAYVADAISDERWDDLAESAKAEIMKNLYSYADARAKDDVSEYDLKANDIFKAIYDYEQSGGSAADYYLRQTGGKYFGSSGIKLYFGEGNIDGVIKITKNMVDAGKKGSAQYAIREHYKQAYIDGDEATRERIQEELADIIKKTGVYEKSADQIVDGWLK